MGTNYYLHEKPACPTCGHQHEPLHIGKRSAGWCFSLHVIPELGINTLDDWRKRWDALGALIRDEYGKGITPAEMLAIVTRRGGGDEEWETRNWRWYGSEAKFHASNQSERGPNGLLRHQIGKHCTGHGEGTWDYITGEFS